MKDIATQEAELLEGMPSPRKQKRVTKKKFFSMKHVPQEVAVRRQVSEEIGDAEPTQGEKSILLQKYGVKPAVIDRLVTKPKWMGEITWKQKLNQWFKMTHGLVKAFQPKKHQSRYSANKPQGNPSKPHQKWPTAKRHSRPSNSNNSRPNFAQGRMANRQS